MNNFNPMQPLKDMQRITHDELNIRYDEITDAVINKNIGYIITKDGEDDMVLCPAEWFSPELSIEKNM